MAEEENVEFISEKKERKELQTHFSLKGLIDGSLLAKEAVVKQLPFFLFLAFMALFYIANRYHAEKIVGQSTRLEQQMKEYRAKSMSISSELMFLSKQSGVMQMIEHKGLGLKESVEPPQKIVVQKK
ncbi:MAG: FtsL-like putative cell division protein [Bacteroidales bacterium]